ncbi:hypothetical protein HF521_020033 [Silurus meridionalis]|uniref:AAA+ ATPase domain-containing protein n=1 Tax=Silurus meridionalis TaxID=175797 RepID=A0A8T0BI59_SILME|nr:hypothetical protein HF521_020033 [Silurus meridionalis]
MATGSQETSLTVRDLIQKSKLISEGPPARYRLLTTRSNLQNDGSVRKWTFGQQDNTMHNKILLIVGETGTGKTTLINAMVNYILRVKFTDEVWFEITEEGGDNKMSDQSKSQTSKVTMYEVFVGDNPLTIIDTPGYGDTRGKEHDQQIAENLYTLFRSDSGVKEIDAVCLVVKASDNRLSDRQQYIFDAVLSSFGKDIENNIVIFITHSYGLSPENVINAVKKAEIPCRTDEENEPEHFLLNNCQSGKRSLKYKKTVQTAWEQVEEILDDFFSTLKEQNRKSLEQTERVLSESKQLKACISNLQNRIDFAECKSKELVQIQKALQENREKIKRNVNFTFTVTEHYKVKVPIENASWWDRKATTCSVCEENCHEYGCWFAGTIWRCKVMKHGHCTSCTGKCCYSKHVKENKKYVTRSKVVTKTYEDIKQQYESIKKQEGENLSIENRLKNELTNNKKEKSNLVEEAYRSIMKLYEIALKPDSAFIVQCLDFLIPRAEEIGKHDYARKLSDLREIKPESQERVNTC